MLYLDIQAIWMDYNECRADLQDVVTCCPTSLLAPTIAGESAFKPINACRIMELGE